MSQNKNNMLFFGVLIAVFIIFAILGSFSSDNAEDTLFPETTAITQTTTEITTETTATTITTTELTTAETTAISQPAEVTNINETVYIGKTGTKYHRQDCGTLKGNGTAITLDEALAEGRTACKICKP